MPLFLITGLPGTGKSTVNTELKSRGYTSYDADEDHIAHWFDKYGNVVKKENEKRTPEFVRAHTRDISVKTVKVLAVQADNIPVFLCGDPENEAELRSLFLKVYALVLDENERQRRLATRTNNHWGKLPHEREYDLKFQKEAPKIYKEYAYRTIDAAQLPTLIVDQILRDIIGNRSR